MQNGQANGLSLSYYPSGYLKAEALMKEGKLVEQHFWKDGERPPPARTAQPAAGETAGARP